MGVDNYVTTLTLTTRGTNTFLFFGEEDSLELDALETLFNSFSTRSTRFTTVFKIDVISLRADLTSGSVQLTCLSLTGCGLNKSSCGEGTFSSSLNEGFGDRVLRLERQLGVEDWGDCKLGICLGFFDCRPLPSLGALGRRCCSWPPLSLEAENGL